MRRLLAVLSALLGVLAVLLVLAVGCGESEREKLDKAKAAYVDDVNAAQDRHLARISNLATPDPTKRVINQQADELRALAADLRKIKAPEGVGAQHSQLVAALALAEQEVREGDALTVAMGRVRAAVDAINGEV